MWLILIVDTLWLSEWNDVERDQWSQEKGQIHSKLKLLCIWSLMYFLLSIDQSLTRAIYELRNLLGAHWSHGWTLPLVVWQSGFWNE